MLKNVKKQGLVFKKRNDTIFRREILVRIQPDFPADVKNVIYQRNKERENMDNKEKRFVASGGGVSYHVVYDDNVEGAGYGIYAEMENEKTDSMCVRGIFFTEEEASLRCKWLCENQVFPVSLRDVLRNIV